MENGTGHTKQQWGYRGLPDSDCLFLLPRKRTARSKSWKSAVLNKCKHIMLLQAFLEPYMCSYREGVIMKRVSPTWSTIN